MAEKYAHDFYPPSPQRRGFVDWATDRFATTMYTDAYQCLYPVFGSAEAPENPAQAGADCMRKLNDFADLFSKEKFVGGECSSIADYRVAPFSSATTLREKFHVTCPERTLQLSHDFVSACPAAGLISTAGHFLKEI